MFEGIRSPLEGRSKSDKEKWDLIVDYIGQAVSNAKVEPSIEGYLAWIELNEANRNALKSIVQYVLWELSKQYELDAIRVIASFMNQMEATLPTTISTQQYLKRIRRQTAVPARSNGFVPETQNTTES